MDIVTVAFSTLSLLNHVSDSRDLTKEEILLREQSVRTLKESMRYNEVAYQKLIAENEEEKV
ncbi:MAG: hypothetical protein E6R03_04670 [Hyphomicrobiaceae bacterium]|nr:MAG: hypothetical protein E6R03_04670 [Hyphomicrobiaceae bacterium]